MANTPARLLVAVAGPVACVKICGRANFMGSPDFRALVYELRERRCPRLILDLTDCSIMDSTFLGTLAGFALRSSESARPAMLVELWNPNARIVDLLDNLGVIHLFRVVQGVPPLTECQPVPEPAQPATKTEASRVALEAHETLMRINPANIPKFKDVTRFLAEDLKKTEL